MAVSHCHRDAIIVIHDLTWSPNTPSYRAVRIRGPFPWSAANKVKGCAPPWNEAGVVIVLVHLVEKISVGAILLLVT